MFPALLLSELFPPAVGGSAELFANVYSRFTGHPASVLTAAEPGGPSPYDDRVPVLRVGDRTTRWGLLDPAGWLQHARAIRQLRASTPRGGIVHCGRVLPEGLHAWLSRRAGGAPYVCWAHGEELNYARLSRELRFLMTRIYRDAAAVLANSRNTAALLAEFGVRDDAIAIAYPGVDAARFRPDPAGVAMRRHALAAPDEVLLLTVGRLQRRKGHDLVLRALHDLGDRPVRYVIVGDGEERTRLERLADDLGLRSRVRFEGVVAPDDLPSFYAAADVFVHPNRVEGVDFEGFGIVFIEAAAAGLPVIGGASGGVTEAVAAGDTGLLVGGTDAVELREAIQALVDAPDLRRAMGDRGRVRAAGFTWDRTAAVVEGVHERVAVAGRR